MRVSTKPHSQRDSSQRQRKLRFVGTSSTVASYLEPYQKALQEERELHYAIYYQEADSADDVSEATIEPEVIEGISAEHEEHVAEPDNNQDNTVPDVQVQGEYHAPLPEFELSPAVIKRTRKRIRELIKSEDERTEKILKEWTDKWV